MQVQVSGKRLDVGDALRGRIGEELSSAMGKYFERGGDAEVTVSRDRYGFRIDCLVTLASGQQLQSHGTGADTRTAFDQALGKIETRIRRYKRRLKSHADAATHKEAETASLYVLRASDEAADDADWEEGEATRPPAAMIIAETESALKTMTVSMAVMELDFTDAQTIVFRNAAHGGLSVVYRRPDGNIGWIDPQRTKATTNGLGPRP
jgi:ribosomal subunit interface protein